MLLEHRFMKIEILALICLMATALIQAQDRKSGPWTERTFKHEISLDVSPAIKWAIAQTGRPESVGFTYRCFFKNKHGLRLGYRSTFSKYHHDKLEYVGFKKHLTAYKSLVF